MTDTEQPADDEQRGRHSVADCDEPELLELKIIRMPEATTDEQIATTVQVNTHIHDRHELAAVLASLDEVQEHVARELAAHNLTSWLLGEVMNRAAAAAAEATR